MSLCGGLAGFSSGFVRRAVGFTMLANLAVVGAAALIVLAYLGLQQGRRTEPGKVLEPAA